MATRSANETTKAPPRPVGERCDEIVAKIDAALADLDPASPPSPTVDGTV